MALDAKTGPGRIWRFTGTEGEKSKRNYNQYNRGVGRAGQIACSWVRFDAALVAIDARRAGFCGKAQVADSMLATASDEFLLSSIKR